MRISVNGFVVSSFFLCAAAFMSGCSGNSSILGDESNSKLEKSASGDGAADYQRAPFSEAGLDDSSLAMTRAVPAVPAAAEVPPAASNGADILNTSFESEAGSCWNRPGVTSGCGVFANMGSKDAGVFQLSENGISHSGSKSVEITYAKNEEFAGTDVGINAETVDVRSWYYFDEGFDFGQGMKIGRVSSFNPATHLNDIDIILEIRSNIGTNQCGTSDMRDLGVYFNGAPRGSDWGNVSATMTFNRKQWYAIEYQVKLNAPGQSNGSVTLWIDGVKQAERTGLSIRGSMSSRLNTVKVGGWYSNGLGGNSCANPATASRMYMDDFVISQGYIGLR